MTIYDELLPVQSLCRGGTGSQKYICSIAATATDALPLAQDVINNSGFTFADAGQWRRQLPCFLGELGPKDRLGGNHV